MEYTVVENCSLRIMIDSVQDLLSNGWLTTGGLTSTSENILIGHDHGGDQIFAPEHTFYQAMTRTRKPKSVSRKKSSRVKAIDVVDLYNDIFKGTSAAMKKATTAPLLGRINVLTEKHFNTIDDWTTFFESLKRSDWLMGKVPPTQGYKQFKLKLEWLINDTNLAKIIDGHYHGEN